MSKGGNEPMFLDGPPKRHPALFSLICHTRDLLSDWIDDAGLKEAPKDALGILRFSAAIRAWNLFKAVVPVLERDFWEDALILIRSLFELLLNIEHVESSGDGKDALARKIFRFQQLQEYQQIVALYEYNVHSGRLPPNDPNIAKLTNMARGLFKEFIESEKSGKIRWAHWWCGKNVAELARTSPNPLRTWQYKVLYAYTSAFVHPTPVSMLSTFQWKEEAVDWEAFKKDHLKNEAESLELAVSLLVMFTLEIIMLVSPSLPKFDPLRLLDIMANAYRVWGVEPPPAPGALPHATARA